MKFIKRLTSQEIGICTPLCLRIRPVYWSVKGLTGSKIQAVMAK